MRHTKTIAAAAIAAHLTAMATTGFVLGYGTGPVGAIAITITWIAAAAATVMLMRSAAITRGLMSEQYHS